LPAWLIRPFRKVESTQSVAKLMAEEGAEEGLVVLAEEQEKGRGGYGRPWYSPKGGLWFSVLLRPNLPPKFINLVGLASALSVAKAIESLYGIRTELKWPNDVVIGGRKVCGVMGEASVEPGRLVYVILGIGVNANFGKEELPPMRLEATTLKDELGREVDRLQLLLSILEELEVNYRRIGERGLLDEIEGRLFGLGELALVSTLEGEMEGRIKGIGEDGSIVLGTDGGDVSISYGTLRLKGKG